MRLSHTLLFSIVLYILLILLSVTAGLLSHSMQQILNHPFISMSRVKQKVFHQSSSLLKEMERQLALVFPLFY